MTQSFRKVAALWAVALGSAAAAARVEPAAAQAVDCPVSHAQLKTALSTAADADSTGLNNNFWGVVVNRTGQVCAVAYSGATAGSQWLLSRQIAAAKAFTANGLSLDGGPISTAMLYPWVQPSPSGGNPLFGLNAGNPVSSEDAYDGDYSAFGTESDPMIGKRVGGTITFGGGLGLYRGVKAIGGLGLSGDTACADHSTAWRTRTLLGKTPSSGDDRLTFGATSGHPHCPNDGGSRGVTPASS
ncbi:heme-binding protein [Hansschlegelia sp. KR7-227]|uniref:heme-binding protein n=1 Tax=Hansschlegelia sp. KR7-227 TaxID=3400914 RepID=UPI003C0559BA